MSFKSWFESSERVAV